MSNAVKESSSANDLLKNSSLYREFQAEREEILRHKWIESEKAGRDIGFEQALTDWIIKHRSSWRKARQAAGTENKLNCSFNAARRGGEGKMNAKHATRIGSARRSGFAIFFLPSSSCRSLAVRIFEDELNDEEDFSMPETTVILDAAAIQRALTRIAHEIAERNEVGAEVVLVGIPVGGDHSRSGSAKFSPASGTTPCPSAFSTCRMHRDDLDQRAAPKIHPTVIPFDVTGKTVVLVDDVLFSGRTTRAAMDALNDFGRPKKIQLAVLIDRGHRELPIKADFVGKNVPTAPDEKISLRLTETGRSRTRRSGKNDLTK